MADRVPVFCDAASVDMIIIQLVGVDFSWLMSYDIRLCKEVEKRREYVRNAFCHLMNRLESTQVTKKAAPQNFPRTQPSNFTPNFRRTMEPEGHYQQS